MPGPSGIVGSSMRHLILLDDDSPVCDPWDEIVKT